MGSIETPKKREYTFDIITGDDFNTNIIDGNLNSLIIDSENEVSVTIESSFGYLIFHNSQHKGIRYYAPRAVMQGDIAKLIVTDQFDKFKLNETLSIRVTGPTSTEVKIIMRLD